VTGNVGCVEYWLAIDRPVSCVCHEKKPIFIIVFNYLS